MSGLLVGECDGCFKFNSTRRWNSLASHFGVKSPLSAVCRTRSVQCFSASGANDNSKLWLVDLKEIIIGVWIGGQFVILLRLNIHHFYFLFKEKLEWWKKSCQSRSYFDEKNFADMEAGLIKEGLINTLWQKFVRQITRKYCLWAGQNYLCGLRMGCTE